MRVWAAVALFVACGAAPDAGNVPWKRSFTFGSPPIQLTIRVQDDSLTAAETAQVELVLDSGPDVRARLPESIPMTGLRVRTSSTSHPQPAPGGGNRERCRLVVEPMLPGSAYIGPITVNYEVERDGQWIGQRLDTAPVGITVLSLGVPETGPVELKPPRGPAWPRTPVLLYLALAFLGVAAVFALVFWLVFRRGRKAAQPVPPDQAALRELAALERRNLLERGEIRRFYGELADVVRRYLDRAFAVPAPDLTTDETLQRLRGVAHLAVDAVMPARELLDEADLVKFAKYEPGRDTAAGRLFAAKAFVRATAPPEETGNAM